jgi:two-component sensor histidine kinase
MQNGLQQIISILSMQVASSENQEIKEHLEKSIKRISSISLIHKTLQGSVHPGNTNLHKYFSSLIKSYKDLNERVVFELVCKENIELDIEKLTSLALIVNELITNSLKYAFEGIKEPIIVITLEKKEQFYFTYEDNGIGFKKEMVTPSIGTKLIEILSKTQLKGDLEVKTDSRYFFYLKFG